MGDRPVPPRRVNRPVCRAEEFLDRQSDCANLLRASLALSLLGPKYLVRIRKSAFPLLIPDRRCAMLPRHNLPARTRSRLLPSLLPITFHTPPFRRRGERCRRPSRSFRQRTCRRAPTSSFPWQSRLPDSGGAASGSLSERLRVSA